MNKMNWKIIYVLILSLSFIMYSFTAYLIYDLYNKVNQSKELLESISTISINYIIEEFTIKTIGERLDIRGSFVFNIYIEKTTNIKGPIFKLLFDNREIGGFTIDYLNVTNMSRVVSFDFTINSRDIDKPIYIYTKLELIIGSAEYRNILLNITSLLSEVLNINSINKEDLDRGNIVKLAITITSVYSIEIPVNALLLDYNMNTLLNKSIESFSTHGNNIVEVIIDKIVYEQTKYFCIEIHGARLLCSKIK